jgi:hypothetical protein
MSSNPPELGAPSARRLLRSTLIAAVAAFVLLITVVLPAEYGIDPTGVGRVLGLTQMGEIKARLAREAAADQAADDAAAEEEARVDTSRTAPATDSGSRPPGTR